MARRRIYKRDADGQFATVNTLINKVLSPSEKRRRRAKLGKTPAKAAGSLNLAMDSAKRVARAHDLSGHNRSDANKAAYRDASKEARALKAKHGDKAPTADKIYSTAKKMQLGQFTNKRGERPGAPKAKRDTTIDKSPPAKKPGATPLKKAHR